ncbi:ARM repeat-containing protein [Hanseniaspora valbyensis NRRL Y-1626]|uniref:ARM repeat-containing protein n=1 Tax=Hanseniaspora valbyensis NRRL Y-1626 TaxID=766949 RepID=A0A1B7TJU4_9ASCO|nr:ARM repeat-containing protein [Hanseniaspora valbyensis NRRL Y-1626]
MGSLRHFIKDVKDASTPKKERDIINKESAKIRTRLKDDSVQGERRRTYTSKLLYLYVLGEKTSFGQVDCINLLSVSSSSVSTLNYEGGMDFENKRLGYLGVILLLKDENQELLTLITNLISQDINNSNKYIAGLALECLGSLANKDLARDLCTDLVSLITKCVDSVSKVDNLLTNSTGNSSYLIKHGLVAASSLLKKDPNLLTHFLNVDNGNIINKIFDTFYGADGQLKKSDVTHGVLLSIVDFITSCLNCKKLYDFDNNYDFMIKRKVIFEILQNEKIAKQQTILNHLIEFLSQAKSNEGELVNYCFKKLIEIHVLESVENSRFLTRAILYCGFYLKNDQIDEVLTIVNNLDPNASTSFIKELIDLLFSEDISKEDKIFFESNFAFKVLSVWCVGEYGSLIIETLDKSSSQTTSQQIVDYFYKINNDYYNTIENDSASFIISYLVTAVAKISTYIQNKALIEKLRQLLVFHSNKTGNLIISVKSNQLLSLFSQPIDKKRQIFAKMPEYKHEGNRIKDTYSVKSNTTVQQVDLLSDLFALTNVQTSKNSNSLDIPSNSKEIFSNDSLKIFYSIPDGKPILNHEANLDVYYKNTSQFEISQMHVFVAVGKSQNIEVGHLTNTDIPSNGISKQTFKIMGQGHLMTRIKLQYQINGVPSVEQFDYKFDKDI